MNKKLNIISYLFNHKFGYMPNYIYKNEKFKISIKITFFEKKDLFYV